MMHSSLRKLFAAALLVAIALLVFFLAGLWRDFSDPGSRQFMRWWLGDEQERHALLTVQRDACPGAPFILPADGFIGLLYADPRGPYSATNPHQGIDIFSNAEAGVVPVYAAYDGYVTREPQWRSSLILRVAEDPLQPGSQIWLYHTHMADKEGNDFIEPDFPPGTSEQFVRQGTLLGYTGDYNGNSMRGIGVHLHFSIVKDNGQGLYSNELDFENTLDPSPYLGMKLHYACEAPASGCTTNSTCL